MAMTQKIAAGASFPAMAWPTADGSKVDIAGTSGWRMLVVYRGKHCPLCKKYFATLDGMLEGFKSPASALPPSRLIQRRRSRPIWPSSNGASRSATA